MAAVLPGSDLRQQEISCRNELIAGKIEPEEYFGLVLSILGNDHTYKGFPAVVQEIAAKKPQFHNPLRQLYETYFAQVLTGEHVNNIGATVGIQQPSCTLDEELDIELAIQLSLKETGVGGSDIYEPDEVNNITYAGWGDESEAHWPQPTPVGRGRGRGSDVANAVGNGRTQRRAQGAWNNGARKSSEPKIQIKKNAWTGQTANNYNQNCAGTMFTNPHKFTFISTAEKETNNPKTQSKPVPVPVPQKPRSVELGANKKPTTQHNSSTVSHCQGTATQYQHNDHQQTTPSDDSNKKKTKKKKKAGSIPRPLSRKPVIYWFRRDLRIYDNPALMEASVADAPIIPVFLWSEVEEGPLAAGGATKLWLHHALHSLNETFQERFQSQILFINTKSCLRELQRLVRETGAGSLVWNDVYEPYLKRRDDKICEHFKNSGISVTRHHSYLLYEPASVNMESVGLRGLGSVTHFMEACRQSVIEPIAQPIDAPSALPHPSQWPASHTLKQLDLAKMPRRKDGSIIDWAAPMVSAWDFSENAAYDALQEFLSGAVRRYDKESGRADQLNTCHISPYLHFGQISPRTVLAEAKFKKCNKFLRKLAWRDLSYFLLDMFPTMDSEALRPHYKHQRWSNNKQHLFAWQRGHTGYPLVDAAMRELWATGWMNNYMRHVVASFLISYLHLHWIEGYKWFQDTLMDADVAINAMMWQNGGMSGLDHWNFVMHPVDAAMTCDPSSIYIRRWVPELAALPDDYVCKPWKCPPSILRRAGIQLGVNYPERIITDLEAAREQSLRDAVEVRLRHGKQYVDRRTGNDLIPLPSGLLLPVITRKEFKYKTSNPHAEDNPFSAVLHGYRSRKRDEAVAFANQVDFLSSTMNECVLRSERASKTAEYEMY